MSMIEGTCLIGPLPTLMRVTAAVWCEQICYSSPEGCSCTPPSPATPIRQSDGSAVCVGNRYDQFRVSKIL